ncbi:MAG: hypothetical protein HY787_09825 [Deltaproteobacteria bacterium]|nr:hypothetical protein [Deltaproteobacteria bacterium]
MKSAIGANLLAVKTVQTNPDKKIAKKTTMENSTNLVDVEQVLSAKRKLILEISFSESIPLSGEPPPADYHKPNSV